MPNWKKLIVSGSDATLNSLTVTQNISASAFTGSLQGTASIANKVTGGNTDYIPLWTGAYTFSSSLLYQTGSSVLLGSTTQHTPEAPDRFGVFAGVTDSYNLISAHGEIDNYLQLNVKNFSAGATASSDFVATADVGDEFGAYINLGINSSTYALDGAIGQALDGYLFVTGSNLLIGNTSPDKKIILFTGGGDATANARVFIDPSGSVSINTAQLDPSAPDALRVRSVPFTTTYNVITAIGETDGYAQINMKNTGSGDNVSSDIVATANNGDETTNFVNMGINGATYTGTIGGPNDSYVYSTGGHLHLGAIDPGKEIMLFVGGEDVMMTTKLTLRDNNHHELSGSLFVTGGMVISQDLTVNGTLVAEKFLTEYITSSVIYESGSTKFGDTSDDLHQFTGSLSVLGNISGSLVLPSGIVSSSSQINTGSFTGSFDGLFTGQVIGTSSWAVNAITASYVESLVLPNNIVTASSQIDHNLTTNYVADQHIDHTVVSIIAGDGLVGGGNISASRTLTLDTGSLHFLNAIKNKLNIEGVISSSTQFQDNLFNIDTYEFVTDGVQNTFNLTNQYDSSSLIVTVDGLTFSPIDDYTVSSTNIVFTSPLVSESLILVRAFVNASDAVGTFTGSLLGTASYATNALSASWAPGGSAIAVLDEGSQLTSTVTSLNFVGTGVSASNVGDTVTITVSGGGGGVTFAEVLKAVSLRI